MTNTNNTGLLYHILCCCCGRTVEVERTELVPPEPPKKKSKMAKLKQKVLGRNTKDDSDADSGRVTVELGSMDSPSFSIGHGQNVQPAIISRNPFFNYDSISIESSASSTIKTENSDGKAGKAKSTSLLKWFRKKNKKLSQKKNDEMVLED